MTNEQGSEPTNPMADVFKMDQAMAAEDEATRDQVAWELHVAQQRSVIAAQQALTKRISAWSGLIETVAFGLGFVVSAVIVVALFLGAQYVVGFWS